MPGMSGRELAERLVRERPQLRMLYTSGYTDDAIVHRDANEPGSLFIHKPFTPAKLLDTGAGSGDGFGVGTSPARSEILKVLPRPGSLSTEIEPPVCLTMPYTVEQVSLRIETHHLELIERVVYDVLHRPHRDLHDS